MSSSTLTVERKSGALVARLHDYVELTKPRISILVLVAVGFEGAELEPFPQIETTGNGTINTDEGMKTNLDGIFAAGDACMGQSIVVWAIGEGRDVARQIDIYLTGDSVLPASLRTTNPPTAWASSP